MHRPIWDRFKTFKQVHNQKNDPNNRRKYNSSADYKTLIIILLYYVFFVIKKKFISPFRLRRWGGGQKSLDRLIENRFKMKKKKSRHNAIILTVAHNFITATSCSNGKAILQNINVKRSRVLKYTSTIHTRTTSAEIIPDDMNTVVKSRVPFERTLLSRMMCTSSFFFFRSRFY